MRKILTGLISISLLSACIHPDYSSLDREVNMYMSDNHVPGLVCAVVKDEGISWSKPYGLADVEMGNPMSINGIMNVGSITKTITATAVMQLWEKGQIDLEEDINHYLTFSLRNPHFPQVPVSVHQLLTHSSSLVDGTAYYNSYACGDPKISLGEWMLNYFWSGGDYYDEEENFTLKKPGEEIRYSNVGYGLLGYIVEEISGMPFSKYCRENIFEPLDMKNSGFYLSEHTGTKHIRPYLYISEDSRKEIMKDYAIFFPEERDFYPDSYVATCLYSFPNYPDGLLRTSVEELSHFLLACMNGGEYKGRRILLSTTLEKMLSLQVEGNPSQGLCWHKSGFESMWGHGGSDPGIQTSMYFNPPNKTGIILFQNSGQGNLFSILEKVYRIAERN